MTINLTDPANHPANGPLTVERIIRVRDELQRTHGKIMNIPVNKGFPEPSKGTPDPSRTSLFCV